MELTDRKKKVLRSVVDLYIRTAEPVGSKAITELPDMNYSSATIRNEMADLTAMGYLEQPHTSAGRIPSAAGYRLYVDELMMDYRLSVDETKSINNAIEEKVQRVDKLVEKVAKLVSQATDLPAISAASRSGGATVTRYDLIQAGQGSFILVVMLSSDEVFNKLIKLPLSVQEGDLRLLGAVLNSAMTDLGAEDFTSALLDKVMRSAGAAASLVPVIVDFTTDVLRHQASTNVAVAGQARLLGLPEYKDVDKAQKVLESIDEDALSNLPAIMQSENGTKVLVGPENVAQELKDTSVVMTKFDIGDGMQGMIGVVGPTRMDYAKVTARLSYFAESLSKAFAKPETKQLPQPGDPAESNKEGIEVAKKEEKKQPETTQEETVTPEQEAPAPEQTPETPAEPKEEKNPFEEKYNAEHDSYLRLAAEFDNFRKRTVKEKEASYGNGKADAVVKLLPIYDNLERALNQPTEDVAYKKGVELTMNELVKIFTGLGVEIFGAPGDSFDPNLHNAVMHTEDESLGENVIAQVFQKGFKVGDKIVRFAMVQVAN